MRGGSPFYCQVMCLCPKVREDLVQREVWTFREIGAMRQPSLIARFVLHRVSCDSALSGPSA